MEIRVERFWVNYLSRKRGKCGKRSLGKGKREPRERLRGKITKNLATVGSCFG